MAFPAEQYPETFSKGNYSLLFHSNHNRLDISPNFLVDRSLDITLVFELWTFNSIITFIQDNMLEIP